MVLGILVTTDLNITHLDGLARAAVRAGHEVVVFMMDEALGALRDERVLRLASLEGVDISFCDFSAMLHEVSKEGLPDNLKAGSQFNNAKMMRIADRVIHL